MRQAADDRGRARARRWSLAMPLLILLCATTAGCGSSHTSGLAAADASRLHSDVNAIRSAAARHDPQTARSAAKALEAEISQLRASGRLASADATVLLADAAQLDSRLATQVTAPGSTTATSPPQTTTVTATTSQAPAAAPPGQAKKKKKTPGGPGHGPAAPGHGPPAPAHGPGGAGHGPGGGGGGDGRG